MNNIKFNITTKVGTNPTIITYHLANHAMEKPKPNESKDEKKRRKLANAPKTSIISQDEGKYFYLDTGRYYSLEEIQRTGKNAWKGPYDTQDSAIAADYASNEYDINSTTEDSE